MTAVIGVMGIIASIALLVFLSYKGVTQLVAAPLCALLIALTNGLDILGIFTDTFLAGVSGFIQAMFGVVLLSCIVAELYVRSGAALSIANAVYDLFTGKARAGSADRREAFMNPVLAILAIYIIGVGLAYGGLNAFVLSFLLYPIALDLLQKANIPRYMAPGIVLGALATAASSMPGTTSDPNVIASLYLGTSPMAAAVPGFLGGALVITLNVLTMNTLAKRQIKMGNGFILSKKTQQRTTDTTTPAWYVAMIPLVATIILYNAVKLNILAVLLVTILLSIILFWKHLGGLEHIRRILNTAGKQSAEIVLMVGCLSAVGAVVAATPVFKTIAEGLIALPLPGLFKALVAIAVVTAFAGSGPAGLAASLPTFNAAWK